MARNFDNNNPDHIEVGDIPILDLTDDEVTLSIWVKIDGVNGEFKVFAKWADDGDQFQYLLSLKSNGHALFATKTANIKLTEGITDLNDGAWHHVAGVYDGSDVKIYVDGVLENTTIQTGNMLGTTSPIRLGAAGSVSVIADPFDGDLGHASLWDVSLSAGEIKSLAEGVNPLKMFKGNNLLFYAPLNGQNPEYDVVGGLNMTVIGTTKVDEPPIPNSIIAP